MNRVLAASDSGNTVLGIPEPSYLRTTRAAYDTVAVDYAGLLSTALAAKPLDRALLAVFAELVQAAGVGPVADLGCGPGRVTAHLHSLGLSACGVDLSPGMVAVARRAHPGLQFDEGSMTAHAVSLDAYRLSPDRAPRRLSAGRSGHVLDQAVNEVNWL